MKLHLKLQLQNNTNDTLYIKKVSGKIRMCDKISQQHPGEQ